MLTVERPDFSNFPSYWSTKLLCRGTKAAGAKVKARHYLGCILPDTKCIKWGICGGFLNHTDTHNRDLCGMSM